MDFGDYELMQRYDIISNHCFLFNFKYLLPELIGRSPGQK